MTSPQAPAPPAPPAPPQPWYKRLRIWVVGLIVAALASIPTGFAGKGVGYAWDRITGEDRAHLTLLDLRVAGETATNSNYNADALQRLVSNGSFPHFEMLLRNKGGKTGTVQQVDMQIKRVWTLIDPHGPVTPPKGAPDVKTPDFGAYGGKDVRLQTEGYLVPNSISQAFDIAPRTSKLIKFTVRNIEDPSTKEYIARMALDVRYDGDQHLKVSDVFFSSAAIGSYYPAYERKLIRPEPGYDEAVAVANKRALAEVRQLEGHKSPRVQFLEAELMTID